LLKKEIAEKFFLIERCKTLEALLKLGKKDTKEMKSNFTQTSEGFVEGKLNRESISDYCKTYFHQDIQNISIKT